MDSASANSSAFSSRQKYCDRNSSGRQITCAPLAVASRTFHSALARFSFGSSEHLICTKPILKDSCISLYSRRYSAYARGDDPGNRERVGFELAGVASANPSADFDRYQEWVAEG